MMLLLFYNGSTAEIENCEDVVHVPGFLVCVDGLGASVATFEDGEILGYTMDGWTIRELKSPGGGGGGRRRRRRPTWRR